MTPLTHPVKPRTIPRAGPRTPAVSPARGNTTVDGWAQGFELPTGGGRLDVTFDAPLSHTA
ncbi:hypothetical protein AB0454_44710, partial [Streptomyces sp. NPDC093509]|uniref:hypothetical protein n=1 Tax=Streptomyces sp. NPDC093509 TaxID=3154982 RepID=UPI00344F39E2